MNTLMQSQIFFFISSIGFIILSILVAILLFYLIRIGKIFSGIAEKLEKDINNIENSIKEIVEEIRSNSILNLIFKRKKKTKKNNKKS